MPQQQDGKNSQWSSAATGTAPGAKPATTEAGSPDVITQAKETVSNVASQAGNKVTSRLDAQKDRAAEGLSGVVKALRQTGQQLREQDQTGAAHEYLNSATNQVERVADYIRSTDVKQMVGQVEQFARRQPALFIGGAFVLGLLGARFLKSSSQTNAAYAGPTPRAQSLVPSGNYAATPTVPTGQSSRGASAGSSQANTPITAKPAGRKEGV